MPIIGLRREPTSYQRQDKIQRVPIIIIVPYLFLKSRVNSFDTRTRTRRRRVSSCAIFVLLHSITDGVFVLKIFYAWLGEGGPLSPKAFFFLFLSFFPFVHFMKQRLFQVTYSVGGSG